MVYNCRSAGKNNLSADELVSKLEKGSSNWSKASLQGMHALWSEHGASVRAQQEAQSMLSIGQVRSNLGAFPPESVLQKPSHFIYLTFKLETSGFLIGICEINDQTNYAKKMTHFTLFPEYTVDKCVIYLISFVKPPLFLLTFCQQCFSSCYSFVKTRGFIYIAFLHTKQGLKTTYATFYAAF